MNAVSAASVSKAPEAKSDVSTVTPQMKMVLDYLAEYGEMSDEDLQELLNIKKTRAYLLSRQMSEMGLIEVIGKGSSKRYRRK